MASKKTVVQMFEELLALCETEEQREFVNKRIEITKKKNAGGGEPTEKQKAQMAVVEQTKTAIVTAMVEGATYTPSDLVKLLNDPSVTSTQKLTPMLTALVAENRMVKTSVKGRNMYSLPTVAEE